jgi:hypothetical protein
MKRVILIGAATALGASALIWQGIDAKAAGPNPAMPGASVPPAAAGAVVPGAGAAGVDRPPSDRSAPMPREYAVLLTRSIFVRGHMAEAGHAGGQHIPSSAPVIAHEEANLVFNGVTRTDHSIDALIEDTTTGQVHTVHSGDSIARGSIGTITMDSLQYLGPTGGVTIQIGQNLAGGQSDMSDMATLNTPAGSSPAGSGMSPQDILERLRQKRLAALNGH